MDFVQGLDSSKLVIGGVGLSFFLSVWTSPPYNLAIYLFGAYAQEQAEAIQPLKTFVSLLGASVVFDAIWMFRHEQHWFIKTVSVLLLLLKIPTLFSLLLALRQRGAQFGGLGSEGTTVWSMPGGFTSSGRDGYQNVDDDSYNHHPASAAAPKPSGPNTSSTPGAYEAV